jgi:hypothetical protein
MSELDYWTNTGDGALQRGMIQQCRWHGYYDINIGCEKCRREESKQKLADHKQKLSGIFNNVVWLEE